MQNSAPHSNPPLNAKTRFAPSPTGFIHLGNIRSALYPWAFARSSGGGFVMRIEDTDEERNSQAAVEVILESMQWLGLDYDEGPYYQSQRMERYKEVLAQMLKTGQVYPCYMSVTELDALRERQMENKEKPRYDGTWRPEEGKTLPAVPEGVAPVLRFKNPLSGSVVWEDKVKGQIEISNAELDDLVVARPAPLGEIGTPTYNFCVVVDDMDMGISHVIRGDDHVNNTPRQINIFKALGYPVPTFAHLPTVLNEAGEKMSKRSGAKAVTQYRDEGYLPDAMLNYLARLGWSHGDDEVFSRQQFLEWFNLDHLGRSAAQFDEVKLRWVNAQHIKMTDSAQLVQMLKPHLIKDGLELSEAAIWGLCALYKDRAETLLDIVAWAHKYLPGMVPKREELAQHLTDAVRPAIMSLAQRLDTFTPSEWTKEGVAVALKATLAEYGLKMPQLAMPVRVLALGTAHTPSVDAALALFHEFDKNILLERLRKA